MSSLKITFFGARCAACRQKSGGEILCGRCSPPHPNPNIGRCPGCWQPWAERSLCDICLDCPLPYTMRWLWVYEGRARDLVALMKYDPNPDAAHYIGRRIAAAGLLHPADLARTIVPVPSTSGSIRRRGFLQTALIAASIARSFGISAPIHLNALKTDSRKPNQASLGHNRRLRMAAGKFSAEPSIVGGRQILLVEDVATTGATLAACAAALRSAGAGHILAVAAARSETFHLFRREISAKLARPAPVHSV